MTKRRLRCRCGHTLGWHMASPSYSFRPCMTNRCMNVCDDFDLLIEPLPGERPIFGVHRVREPWDDDRGVA